VSLVKKNVNESAHTHKRRLPFGVIFATGETFSLYTVRNERIIIPIGINNTVGQTRTFTGDGYGRRNDKRP